ncbi:unnamed protein product, partial [Trichobilharzia szidati]
SGSTTGRNYLDVVKSLAGADSNQPAWKAALRWLRSTLNTLCTLNTYLAYLPFQ